MWCGIILICPFNELRHIFWSISGALLPKILSRLFPLEFVCYSLNMILSILTKFLMHTRRCILGSDSKLSQYVKYLSWLHMDLRRRRHHHWITLMQFILRRTRIMPWWGAQTLWQPVVFSFLWYLLSCLAFFNLIALASRFVQLLRTVFRRAGSSTFVCYHMLLFTSMGTCKLVIVCTDSSWLKLSEQVIIDVRNAYESAIGHFAPPEGGAELIDPKMRNSHEFPKWLNAPETKQKLQGKKVGRLR